MALPALRQGASAAVRVRGLTRKFAERRVIDAINIDIAPGEFVALVGASGCGKSTLLRVLAGLDVEAEGELDVPGRCAVAFQTPRLTPWKKVWSNVALGLPDGGFKDRARTEAALAEVGLSHRVDVWPQALSGGETQRAALARALVRNPDLLLLDEPFASLDGSTRLEAQALVREIWRRHRCSVLLVTRDAEEALLLADRVLVMENGRIAHELPVNLLRPRKVDQSGFAPLQARLLGWLVVGAQH